MVETLVELAEERLARVQLGEGRRQAARRLAEWDGGGGEAAAWLHQTRFVD